MRFWVFISALAIATFLGTKIHQDPGYALFAYGNWTIEMPLWITVFLLIMTIAASLIVLWTINLFFSGSKTIQYLWKRHQAKQARLQTYHGLLELEEGRWQKAEKYLTQSASRSEIPVINYLSAAKAAEEGGSTERRDHYLQLALDLSAGSEVAVRLTQAQLQLKHGELSACVKNLQRLHQETPKHPKVLRLLCTLYEAMDDWQSLFALLPALRNTKALPKQALERLEQKIYPALLPSIAEKGERSLIKFWQECPAKLQANPSFVLDYAKLLVKQSAEEEAEIAIRTALKKTWDSDLVNFYGLVAGRFPKKQLSFAESLLPNHFDDPHLQLTLGRLCLRNQLWGKAREHLEQSLMIKPLIETYAELSQLMDQLGLLEKRDEYYKKGLLTVIQPIKTTLNQTHLCLSAEDRL